MANIDSCRVCLDPNCETSNAQRSDQTLIYSLVHNLLRAKNSSIVQSKPNRVNPLTVVRWMYERLKFAKDPISIMERIITDHQRIHRWIGLVTEAGVTVQDGDLQVSNFWRISPF